MSSVDAGENVFFRSIATRNLPGGVPSHLSKMVDLLVEQGWSKVIIETVGAGQSEIRVVAVADRILLVEGPARGDVIQAEKAGILELADIVAVNKCDLEGADRVAEEIRLSLNFSADEPAPVVLCSAETGEGIENLVTAINRLSSAKGPAIAKARERLLAAHQELMLNHPNFTDAVKGLSDGRYTVEEALRQLR